MSMHRAVLRALDRFAKNSELLALVDRPGLERLSTCGSIEHREADEVVVRQGDIDGQTFYLIVAGSLAVWVQGEQGDGIRQAATLTGGHFFGEIGTLTRQPRSATVRTLTPVELIAFPREPVLAVLSEYPAVKEIIGSVGLARTEENLRGDGMSEIMVGGLAEALEGPDE